MNPNKPAWEAPTLRSEKVQETLARPACKIKLDLNLGNGASGHAVHAQALFS